MEIALLNTRIMIEKSVTRIDEIGNHTNEWADYFSCMATVSGEGGAEITEAGITADAASASFTVRWCSETASVSSTGYRIKLKGEVYNIESVDHLAYRKNAIKFICRKELS